GESVDSRDRRLRYGMQGECRFTDEPHEGQPMSITDRCEIGSRAEVGTIAGEDDDPDLVVGGDPTELLGEISPHLGGHRVLSRRIRDDDPRHVSLEFGTDGVSVVRSGCQAGHIRTILTAWVSIRTVSIGVPERTTPS